MALRAPLGTEDVPHFTIRAARVGPERMPLLVFCFAGKRRRTSPRAAAPKKADVGVDRCICQSRGAMVTLRRRIVHVVGAVLGVLLLGGVAACSSVEYRERAQPAPNAETVTPLKIGLLMSFGEGVPDRDLVRRRSFELAIEHINAAGGVFGLPVEVVITDSTLDPEVAVREARRMVEVEGVHAIVGPGTSANTLPVAESVAGPAGIPFITPSATSPLLTTVTDNDFLFRVALSDTAQGPVLARVTRERGFTNVASSTVMTLGGRGWRPLLSPPGRGRPRWLPLTLTRLPSSPRCGRPPVRARRRSSLSPLEMRA